MTQDDNHLKSLKKNESYFFYVRTLAAAGSPDGAQSGQVTVTAQSPLCQMDTLKDDFGANPVVLYPRRLYSLSKQIYDAIQKPFQLSSPSGRDFLKPYNRQKDLGKKNSRHSKPFQ